MAWVMGAGMLGKEVIPIISSCLWRVDRTSPEGETSIAGSPGLTEEDWVRVIATLPAPGTALEVVVNDACAPSSEFPPFCTCLRRMGSSWRWYAHGGVSRHEIVRSVEDSIGAPVLTPGPLAYAQNSGSHHHDKTAERPVTDNVT